MVADPPTIIKILPSSRIKSDTYLKNIYEKTAAIVGEQQPVEKNGSVQIETSGILSQFHNCIYQIPNSRMNIRDQIDSEANPEMHKCERLHNQFDTFNFFIL